MSKPTPLKPIVLYDHLPGILAIYPAVLFAVLAILSLFRRRIDGVTDQMLAALQDQLKGLSPEVSSGVINATEPYFNSHMLFWIGLSVMLIWYVAFRFNMPKSKFMLMFGLIGTFVGIPVVLELSGLIRPFQWTSQMLGHLEPSVNAGTWAVMSLVFTGGFLGNFIYSRTHMCVRIDESGLTLNRMGGKGERFELIGLKTENEPLDYLELFLAGVGSLSLKTRMNKPIFTMKRVVGLYRIPWFPFFSGKLARIEEMLSYQGKVVSVDRQESVDAAEQMDSHDHDDVTDDESSLDGDFDSHDSPESRGDSELR
jgi:hypothetical protein